MSSLMSPARSAKRRSRSTNAIPRRSAINAATVLLPAPPGPISVIATFGIPSIALRKRVLRPAEAGHYALKPDTTRTKELALGGVVAERDRPVIRASGVR